MTGGVLVREEPLGGSCTTDAGDSSGHSGGAPAGASPRWTLLNGVVILCFSSVVVIVTSAILHDLQQCPVLPSP